MGFSMVSQEKNAIENIEKIEELNKDREVGL
jgi:hypothetical protein